VNHQANIQMKWSLDSSPGREQLIISTHFAQKGKVKAVKDAAGIRGPSEQRCTHRTPANLHLGMSADRFARCR